MQFISGTRILANFSTAITRYVHDIPSFQSELRHFYCYTTNLLIRIKGLQIMNTQITMEVTGNETL